MADGTLEELLKIENDGWRALCDSTAAAFYRDLMTEDALMVLANGAIMDRTAVAEALGHAPPWRAYEISDARLVTSGDGLAALVYIGTGYRDGEDAPFVGAMSSVYQRTDGRWRLVLYQQTPVQS
jgi:ketosteroid isomerase-like protein